MIFKVEEKILKFLKDNIIGNENIFYSRKYISFMCSYK